MVKDYIKSPDFFAFVDAMNFSNDICCEMNTGEPCTIDEVVVSRANVTREPYTYIKVSCVELGKECVSMNTGDIRLYRRTFEDGDYIHQQCGDLLICAGIQNGRYLFYAALTADGVLDFPDSEFYEWGSVMPGDRLCTDEEMNKLNGKLMKAGKIFDPVHKALCDSAFKHNTSLFKKFLKEYDSHRHFKLADSVSTHLTADEQETFKLAFLPRPVGCRRGTLNTLGDVIECINAYESRIAELTSMCDEIYAKLKQAHPE